MRATPNFRAGVPASVRCGGVATGELRALLAAASVRLNRIGEELFTDQRFQTSAASKLVNVQVVSAADFGFADGATFSQLADAAAARGLKLCPLELAPHMRLQFPDQAESPEDPDARTGRAPLGAITVASEPPGVEELVPWGFYLCRYGDDLWLRGYRCSSGHIWSPEDLFIFIRPGDEV